MYEAYAADGMSTEAGVCHGTWPVVINALIQRSLAKNELHGANYLVARPSQGLDEDEREFKTQFSKATKQCRHTFTAMQKTNYYVRDLKQSIRKKMLDEVRPMSPSMRSSLIGIGCIAAAKRCSRCALM